MVNTRGLIAGIAVLAVTLAGALLSGCNPSEERSGWEQTIPGNASFSSPRAADLNGDGTKDVVMGGAGPEWETTKYGLFALDGANGNVLWNVSARNQVVGSPVFGDVDGDGGRDVVVGGRSAVLKAVDGRTGAVHWAFAPSQAPAAAAADTTLLNFYSPQFIPDRDGDGIDDVLASYGGDVRAPPFQKERPPGRLMILSGASGDVLAQAKMPDGKETYLSPVVHRFGEDQQRAVVFGTGGETIGGHLYRAPVGDVRRELQRAEILATGTDHGFIAPPVLADVNADGTKDIVAGSFGGTVYSIDGQSGNTMWKTNLGKGFRIYTTPAPGHFDSDETVDFAISAGHGTWPGMSFTTNFVIEGKKGTVIYQDTLGGAQYASPLAFDFTGDGRDELLVVVNEDDRNVRSNTLQALDVRTENRRILGGRNPGTNMGTTPLLSDLDGDGLLDVVYGYVKSPAEFFSARSLVVERAEYDVRVERPIRWGGYMGARGSGVYGRGGQNPVLSSR